MLQIPSKKLNNGVEMPQIGLGLYAPKQKSEIRQAVKDALELGYRHLDSAAIYANEDEVGFGIKDSGVNRKEIFITSKVWMDDMGYDNTLRAFERTLKDLQLEYLDLYLIHWPKNNHRKETWKAMEYLYEQKLVRAIGVSNFYQRHLNEIFSVANIIPAINQFEFTPFCYLPEEFEFNLKHGIQVEAYSPVVRGEKKDHPLLNQLAKKYQKTTYQILIRWVIQMGTITIPKSVNKSRMLENTQVFDFEFNQNEMEDLSKLYDNTRMAWDPRSSDWD